MNDWLGYVNEKDFSEFLNNEYGDASACLFVDRFNIGGKTFFSVSDGVETIGNDVRAVFVGPYGVITNDGELDVSYSPFFTGTTRRPAFNTGDTDFLVFMQNHIPEKERESYYEEYLKAHESAIYIFAGNENLAISKEIEKKQKELSENKEIPSNLYNEMSQFKEKIKQENGIEPPEQSF